MSLSRTVSEINSEILVENCTFNLLHLCLAPLLRVTKFKFLQGLWSKKTRVPVLLSSIVCMVQFRLVKDG